MAAQKQTYALLDENAQFVGNTPQYCSLYVYNKAVPFNIVTADSYHAFHDGAGDIQTGPCSGGWTVRVGRTVDANILAESNVGGQLGIQTSAAHGLVTGDIVVINNANDALHNGATRITNTGADTFTCQDIAYNAGAGASAAVVDEPAQLIAGAASAGTYDAKIDIDGTATGFIAVPAGGRVWLSGKNVTDTSDYTVKNLSLHVQKMN